MTEPATRPHRARKLAIGAGALGLVLALIAAAVTVLPSHPKSATAVVAGSVNKVLTDRTAHLAITTTESTSAGKVSGSGSGEADFTQGTMKASLDVTTGGQSATVPVVEQGGTIYEEIPGLGSLIAGKSWMSLDLSALQGVSSGKPGAAGAGDNPAAMLRLYAEQGNAVVALGQSTVDGVGVDGYAVTVSAATVKSDLAKANLPAWMRQALSTVNLGQMVGDLYVDHSGQLRRYTIHVSFNIASEGTVTLAETIDLSDFGAPVDITPPPPGQVASFQQYLHAVDAVEGSTLG